MEPIFKCFAGLKKFVFQLAKILANLHVCKMVVAKLLVDNLSCRTPLPNSDFHLLQFGICSKKAGLFLPHNISKFFLQSLLLPILIFEIYAKVIAQGRDLSRLIRSERRLDVKSNRRPHRYANCIILWTTRNICILLGFKTLRQYVVGFISRLAVSVRRSGFTPNHHQPSRGKPRPAVVLPCDALGGKIGSF